MVDNLTVEGARVHIRSKEVELIAVGGGAELGLRDTQTGATIVLECLVRYRDEGEKGRFYGVSFTQPTQIRALLTPALARIFNRRQAFRVPLPDGAVAATLQPSRDSGLGLVEAPMLDISTIGCGCLVTRAEEELLVRHTELDLMFKLPYTNLPCAVSGEIRRREVSNGRVRYGIEFRASDDAEYDRSMDVIIKFVMRLQHGLI